MASMALASLGALWALVGVPIGRPLPPATAASSRWREFQRADRAPSQTGPTPAASQTAFHPYGPAPHRCPTLMYSPRLASSPPSGAALQDAGVPGRGGRPR